MHASLFCSLMCVKVRVFMVFMYCSPYLCRVSADSSVNVALQYVKTTFAACKDPLEKQQLCYILGRQVSVWFCSYCIPFRLSIGGHL